MLQNENMICGAVIRKEAALPSCPPGWGRDPETGQTGVQQNCVHLGKRIYDSYSTVVSAISGVSFAFVNLRYHAHRLSYRDSPEHESV